MDYATLKARHRAERDGWHKNLSLRVHRALSWLQRAEQLDDDLDTQFILLWVAFNAAYAQEIDDRYRTTEQEAFRAFVDKLVELDRGEEVRVSRTHRGKLEAMLNGLPTESHGSAKRACAQGGTA